MQQREVGARPLQERQQRPRSQAKGERGVPVAARRRCQVQEWPEGLRQEWPRGLNPNGRGRGVEQ